MSYTESKTVVFRHKKHTKPIRLHGSLSDFVYFLALRPKSTAMVMNRLGKYNNCVHMI